MNCVYSDNDDDDMSQAYCVASSQSSGQEMSDAEYGQRLRKHDRSCMGLDNDMNKERYKLVKHMYEHTLE